MTKEVGRTVESTARVHVCVPFHSFHRASQPSRACLGWSPLRMPLTQLCLPLLQQILEISLCSGGLTHEALPLLWVSWK